MKIEEIISFLKENKFAKKFKITTSDGKTTIKRLFYNPIYSYPCEYAKGSSTKGHFIYQTNVNDWTDISLIPATPQLTKTRNFMKNVVKYLSVSGLWENIKNDYIYLLSLSDDDLNELLSSDWGERRKLLKEKHNMASFHCDCIITSVNKGIKTINYDSYDRDIQKEHFKKALKENQRYVHYWRKGYDNRVELAEKNDSDGVRRAWYSEEFKGCGNGHYYLALDESHALFCEDD